MANHPTRSKKLTEAQVAALTVLTTHTPDNGPRTADNTGISVVTLRALKDRGLVTSARIEGWRGRPSQRLGWTVTDAGRAALQS